MYNMPGMYVLRFQKINVLVYNLDSMAT